MEDKLLEIAAQIFKVDKSMINLNSTRKEVGSWTSFAHLALVTTLEEKLGVVVPFEEVPKIEKLSDFMGYLEEL